jgi:hypothetical protein
MRGMASEVGGIVSATTSMNTVMANRIVMEREIRSPESKETLNISAILAAMTTTMTYQLWSINDLKKVHLHTDYLKSWSLKELVA